MPPKNDSNSCTSLYNAAHMISDLYQFNISASDLDCIASESTWPDRTITSNQITIIPRPEPTYCVEPKTITFRGNVTIVWWKDGTKTVVRLAEGEPYSKFHAFCAAVTKKLFGSASKIQKKIDEHDVDQIAERKKAEEEKARQKEQEAKDRRYRKAVRREAKAMLKDDKHYHDVMEVYHEMVSKNKEESK